MRQRNVGKRTEEGGAVAQEPARDAQGTGDYAAASSHERGAPLGLSSDAELRESDWFVRWTSMDWPLVPGFVLLLAVFTRFWRLEVPAGVVFDEFHFGACRSGE